ncbi:MAG: hypothetical protein HUU38_25625, partial [Anaerolineales bacterium]|nr:hypothetical protein [Anaerolineales bacterium]
MRATHSLTHSLRARVRLWTVHILHVCLVLALLLPNATGLIALANEETAQVNLNSDPTPPAVLQANPQINDRGETISYAPPKIHRPEPRIGTHPDSTNVDAADGSRTPTTTSPWNTVGSAYEATGGRIILTQNENFDAAGAAWNTRQLDLTQNFSLAFRIYLGSNGVVTDTVFGLHDTGADGIVFALQSEGMDALGGAGRNLGYDRQTTCCSPETVGISPSIGIEFDTFYNATFGDKLDPLFIKDHFSFSKNGSAIHNTGNGGIPLFFNEIEDSNLEDGRTHSLWVRWNASQETLSMYLDSRFQGERQYDVSSIFGAQTMVWYGFIGSTGADANLQYFYEVSPLDPDFGASSKGDTCEAHAYQDAQGHQGGPINTMTGGLDYSVTDLSFPTIAGPLSFERYYSSLVTETFTSTLGYGWTHNHAARLTFSQTVTTTTGVTNTVVLFKANTANQYWFIPNGDGTFTPNEGLCAQLIFDGDENYTVVDKTQNQFVFDLQGKLLYREDAHGNTFTYEYGTISGVERLVRVWDNQSGNYLDFYYDDTNDLPLRLVQVSDYAGREVDFSYDLTTGNLITVTDILDQRWTYAYTASTNDPNAPYLLAGVYDPQYHTLERTEYDAQGRAVRQYNGPDTSDLVLKLIYTTTQGISTTLVVDYIDGQPYTRTHAYDGRNTLIAESDTFTKTYDANFNPDLITDPLKHTTRMNWSETGNLETVIDAKEGRTDMTYDALNNLTSVMDASGYLTTYTYNGKWLTKVTDALTNTTLYTYTDNLLAATQDQNGNLTRFAY